LPAAALFLLLHACFGSCGTGHAGFGGHSINFAVASAWFGVVVAVLFFCFVLVAFIAAVLRDLVAVASASLVLVASSIGFCCSIGEVGFGSCNVSFCHGIDVVRVCWQQHCFLPWLE